MSTNAVASSGGSVRPLRVVIVDDEPATCAFLQAVLTEEGHEVRVFYRAEEAEQYLAENEAELALVDVYLGPTNGIELLRRLRDLQPRMYPVVMTAKVSVETAAQSTAEGAIDYVSKPLAIEQVRAIAARADQLRNQERRHKPAAEVDLPKSTIIGNSPKMLEVYKAIGRVAPSNVNVLVTGPSGSGKELVARAIHQHSKRASQPFTAVNCGSLTETILESELFGHERGAFTGAANIHKGLVETTDGGTLFLDEVTETTLAFQVKLLRVIQEQQVRRVGSTRNIPVNVRILAASNRDIVAVMKQGQFREDLYYRLSVVQIAVPPLNERREDIPLLVRHFLQQFNEKNEASVSIDEEAIQKMAALDWPGNVRELENTVNRLAIFAPTGQITTSDVTREAQRANDNGSGKPLNGSGPERLVELEKQHILRILKEAKGNRSEAARRLGIERKSLYKKAVRLGIDLNSTESQ